MGALQKRPKTSDRSPLASLKAVGLWFALATLCLAGSATAQTFRCEGEVGNGYSPSSAGYQTFGSRTHLLTLDCPFVLINQSRPCEYLFNGVRYDDGFMYANGRFNFDLDHFNGTGHMSEDGYLYFQMSEGLDRFEDLIAFYGICTEVD